MPANIQTIGSEAFYSCTALQEVTLSEGIVSIGDYAFQNCQVLETVSLPASCTTLGNYVFDGCQALTAFSVAPESGISGAGRRAVYRRRRNAAPLSAGKGGNQDADQRHQGRGGQKMATHSRITATWI